MPLRVIGQFRTLLWSTLVYGGEWVVLLLQAILQLPCSRVGFLGTGQGAGAHLPGAEDALHKHSAAETVPRPLDTSS